MTITGTNDQETIIERNGVDKNLSDRMKSDKEKLFPNQSSENTIKYSLKHVHDTLEQNGYFQEHHNTQQNYYLMTPKNINQDKTPELRQ
ncbi:unnamed protein product [Didymodactylos carnosus]|uniref:Uncharacterized protein n=1 Tax=Didymodactylos carnosus TaxID=1234261 RepID=A0A814E2E7_9BILA|nr:unnamed protein product [Didymodactylos carnosus]CAF0962875.1 unnamed protein product [Didymodactylos carnosus]CAF3684979.1 unnamed protein product [Didymodactylos carnosus]CAF3737247.1 unnamed protein product [Didymodactylos carnosus]